MIQARSVGKVSEDQRAALRLAEAGAFDEAYREWIGNRRGRHGSGLLEKDRALTRQVEDFLLGVLGLPVAVGSPWLVTHAIESFERVFWEVVHVSSDVMSLGGP